VEDWLILLRKLKDLEMKLSPLKEKRLWGVEKEIGSLKIVSVNKGNFFKQANLVQEIYDTLIKPELLKKIK